MGYAGMYEQIIRPPRNDYYDDEDLGPKKFKIVNDNNETNLYKRSDLVLENERGLSLQCTHYEPHDTYRPCKEMPCVIYLHGNSSSRVEAMPCIEGILKANMTVFTFDFSGCGKSGGEYISLGHYEKDDLKRVIDHLRESGTVSTIGLWGRSMGAATALLHAHRDPSVGGIVLDSTFSSLKVVAEELVKTYASKVPSFLIKGAMKMVKSSIKKKANFDIFKVNPIDHVEEAFIPALFAYAEGDDFVLPHHS